MVDILKKVVGAFLSDDEQAGIDSIAELLEAIFGKILAMFNKDAE